MDIEAFLFDDENTDKFSQHGITDRQVQQVLENSYITKKNVKDRKASYIVIGRDNGGACIAVPIEPTHLDRVWRPVTSWYCKDKEEIQLKNRGS